MSDDETLWAGFIAGAYLQEGWVAGIVDDKGVLLPFHSPDAPGGTRICTMVESVIAGNWVVVESEKAGSPAATGRNATEEELKRLKEAHEFDH